MAIQYKYRFKTKEEFISDLGNNWRNDPLGTGSSFLECMDFLIGKDIDMEHYPYIEKGGYFVLNMDDDNRFGIRSYMYKKVKLVCDYKPRKLVY